MLMTGAATALPLPNLAGRVRLVFPLRYVSWMSTNAYIFAALAAALRMPKNESATAVAAIVGCTFAAFPLEFLPVGSARWIAAATAATAALLLCAVLVMRRVFAVAPLASRHDASMLALVTTVALVSYLTFPAVFFAAVTCGGAGADSCMTVEDEAFFWAIAEGAAKVLVTGAIFVASSTSSNLFDRAERTDAPLKHLRTLALPAKAATTAHTFSWPIEAVFDSLSFLVAVPAFAGAAAFVALSALVDGARTGASADIAAAVTLVRGREGVIIASVAAAAFALTLNSVLRRARVQALAASFLPAGFLASAGDAGNANGFALDFDGFDAANIYYVDEPHVTILMVDVVGFTAASLDTASIDIMRTMGALFRNFDQLHAAAGVTKVETVGDQYVSVVGALGLGANPAAPVPDARAQARAMAGLALDIVAAARDHAWPDGKSIEVRVGLHAGPATTGVIGGALPRWSVFGRSVILASRMESLGAPGRVHASGDFVAALRRAGAGGFALTERSVDVKGVGPAQQTFWVERAVGGGGKGAGAAQRRAASPAGAGATQRRAASPAPPSARRRKGAAA
jgi:class 3 adenylate cyclase